MIEIDDEILLFDRKNRTLVFGSIEFWKHAKYIAKTKKIYASGKTIKEVAVNFFDSAKRQGDYLFKGLDLTIQTNRFFNSYYRLNGSSYEQDAPVSHRKLRRFDRHLNFLSDKR